MLVKSEKGREFGFEAHSRESKRQGKLHERLAPSSREDIQEGSHLSLLVRDHFFKFQFPFFRRFDLLSYVGPVLFFLFLSMKRFIL